MDITLITCSYNTPEITLTMLRSFLHYHNETVNLIVIENSSNHLTANYLTIDQIPFVRTIGATHSPSVDKALKMCKTKYALVVDTDIIFKKNIFPLYQTMANNNIHLMGEVCADRGGFKLHNRVHPWFMLVDVEWINSNGINFHPTDDRISKTNSDGFYNNIPLAQNTGNMMYDVGATFFEDIISKGGNIINAENITNWYIHFEGMSWHNVTDNEILKRDNNTKLSIYNQYYNRFRNISLKNKFNFIAFDEK